MVGRSTHFTKDGLPSDKQIAYYAERARGGAGWVGVGSTVVHGSQLWEQGFNLIDELGSYEAQLTAEYLANLGRAVKTVTAHASPGAKLDGTSRAE